MTELNSKKELISCLRLFILTRKLQEITDHTLTLFNSKFLWSSLRPRKLYRRLVKIWAILWKGLLRIGKKKQFKSLRDTPNIQPTAVALGYSLHQMWKLSPRYWRYHLFQKQGPKNPKLVLICTAPPWGLTFLAPEDIIQVFERRR